MTGNADSVDGPDAVEVRRQRSKIDDRSNSSTSHQQTSNTSIITTITRLMIPCGVQAVNNIAIQIQSQQVAQALATSELVPSVHYRNLGSLIADSPRRWWHPLSACRGSVRRASQPAVMRSRVQLSRVLLTTAEPRACLGHTLCPCSGRHGLVSNPEKAGADYRPTALRAGVQVRAALRRLRENPPRPISTRPGDD